MTLEDRIAAALGVAVVAARRMAGGSLSEVLDLRLADGRRLVAKRAATAEAEGAMLEAIRATGCPAPAVAFAADDLLVMERLEDGGTPGPRDWEAAGAAVAALHAARGDTYGWTCDHAFATVAIPGAPAADWPAFWGERRLLAAPEALPGDIRRRVEALARTLPDRLPARPPPALLHGDLWSGNLLFGTSGFSGLIDPACSYGHAEADLAMLTLFGAPSATFFTGYGGPAPGWERRRPVYQLWPALVHLRLFGAGYRGMVERLLGACGC